MPPTGHIDLQDNVDAEAPPLKITTSTPHTGRSINDDNRSINRNAKEQDEVHCSFHISRTICCAIGTATLVIIAVVVVVIAILASNSDSGASLAPTSANIAKPIPEATMAPSVSTPLSMNLTFTVPNPTTLQPSSSPSLPPTDQAAVIQDTVMLFGRVYNVTTTSRIGQSNTSLTGSIPTEIGLLTMLTGLLLNEHSLSGSIPSEFGLLTRLIYLSLYQSNLGGSIPTEVGLMTALTGLWLSDNNIDGNIPSELQSLTRLTTLSSNKNQFSGSIPLGIGLLTRLAFLDCSQNKLSGSIPTEIGFLTRLTRLTLYDNILRGEIP
ncbi:leucine rich repeat [Seminavis robusta]|uniref:Leucine rich repeat n=1 Tax=Seminavis robusta TaxID=568900 RepID=A0A9N8HDN6_9STRA|nr:leucine rich repeat [Seminavis robusta]|eukprot:Sro266_g103220.1 leucine rich repeat (323) ;mRNA; f:51462-52430